MNDMNLIRNNFEKLKLETIATNILEVLDTMNSKQVNLLLKITNDELTTRDNKAKNIMLKTAGMPTVKTFDDFDFAFNSTIPKGKLLQFQTLDFIENKQNIIFVGSSGVGKTHLATSIGVEATKKRISTYFIKCQKLIDNLKLAYDENRLESRLKHYCKYKVLIIDEMGFLPIGPLESKLLFQLIDLRYESKSTIITTNISFDLWPSVFSDTVIAGAILDRLLHHSFVFKITGDSYRLKDVHSEIE